MQLLVPGLHILGGRLIVEIQIIKANPAAKAAHESAVRFTEHYHPGNPSNYYMVPFFLNMVGSSLSASPDSLYFNDLWHVSDVGDYQTRVFHMDALWTEYRYVHTTF